MNDKKQIEEMAQDIASNCPDLVENCCGGKACYVCIAEGLAKDNYRKIPENAVVIPEKITEQTSPSDLIKIAIYNERVRKETAREILQWLIEHTFESCIFETYFREQYGVEIE